MKLQAATLAGGLIVATALRFAYPPISQVDVPLTTGTQNYGQLAVDELAKRNLPATVIAVAYDKDVIDRDQFLRQFYQALNDRGELFAPPLIPLRPDDAASITDAIRSAIAQAKGVILALPLENGTHRNYITTTVLLEHVLKTKIPVVTVGKLVLDPRSEQQQTPVCDRSGSDDVGNVLDIGCLMLKRSHIEQLAKPDLAREHAVLEAIAPDESMLLIYKP